MPSGLQRNGRGVFAAEAELYEDQQKAETEKLLAAHYYARRKRVARGYTVEHRKMPRGWHHALAARDPVTRRSYLPGRAVLLLNALYNDAELVPASTGARRVFGKTQAFYAMLLGLSMRRSRNGEPHGARRIREYLRLLSNLNIIQKGGRCWFDGPGKHPRLVLWLRPFEQWTLTRFAEAVTALPSENGVALALAVDENDRISRSGCFTDQIEINSEVCGGMGGTGGKEAPSAPSIASLPEETIKERPSAASSVTDRPTAGAGEGNRANSTPLADDKLDAAVAARVLGATALRVFRGVELGELIQHIAKTHPRPVDAADGRLRGLPSPRASRAANSTPGPRPHAAPCGCTDCVAWARALVAGPPLQAAAQQLRSSGRPAQRSPWAEAARSTLAPDQLAELVEPAPLESLMAGAAGRAPLPTLQEALGRRVQWQRTRCYAREGYCCTPGARLPCQHCVDVDFPFRAVVDGNTWKLHYQGKHAPFRLIVDGRELGTVPQSWPPSWRSHGTALRR
jgi:hypothetical protein